MHPYSTNSNERRVIIFVFALISVGLIYVLNLLLNTYQYYIPFELQPPSVATIFGGIFFVFDRYIWQWSIIRKLSLVKVPNLNGVWNVSIQSSYHEDNTETIAHAEIKQTWTKISIKIETEYSYSYSNTSSILLDTLEGDIITYTFLNKPYPESPGSMSIHEGTVKLRQTDTSLNGQYYSGRNRNNYGSITFEKKGDL